MNWSYHKTKALRMNIPVMLFTWYKITRMLDLSDVCQTEKAPQHETDLFTHARGLLYEHITDSGQKFLALVIPKPWKFTVLVEDHDILGHQGNTRTYCLINASINERV